MESSSKQYIEEIDIFRAIAFLLVAAIHFYNPAKHFIDTPNLSNDMMTTLLFSGGIGVQIFLFLSGFSLTIGRCDKNQKTEAELDVKNFFINRALRIFPLWFLCVLILY